MSCPSVDEYYTPSTAPTSHTPMRASASRSTSTPVQEATHNYAINQHVEESEKLVCVLYEDISRIKSIEVIAKGQGTVRLVNDYLTASIEVESGSLKPYRFDFERPYIELSKEIIEVKAVAKDETFIDVALIQVNV